MNIIPTAIEGLLIIEPAFFGDSRGYFVESYNEKNYRAAGIDTQFVQDNESLSSYGVLRGLHAQAGEHAQAKLVRVIEGRVLDIAVDIREGSPTYGQHVAVELSGENKRQLFIPRGFLHGFCVLSEQALFAYKCDAFYNKESEIGVRFDDPALGIKWPLSISDMLVSDKDLQQKGFTDVIAYRS